MPLLIKLFDIFLSAKNAHKITMALASDPLLKKLMDEKSIMINPGSKADDHNKWFYPQPKEEEWEEVGPYALVLVEKNIPDSELIRQKVKACLDATKLFNHVTVMGVYAFSAPSEEKAKVVSAGNDNGGI